MSTLASAANEFPTEQTDQRRRPRRRLGPTLVGLLTLMVLLVTAGTGGRASIRDTAAQDTPTVGLETVVSVVFVMLMLLGLFFFGAIVVVGRGRRRSRTPNSLRGQVFAVISVVAVLAILIRIAPELLDRLRLIAESLSDPVPDEATIDGTGDVSDRLLPDLDARWLTALALLGGAIVFGLSRRRSTVFRPVPTEPSQAHIPDQVSDSVPSSLAVDLDSIAKDPDARRAIIGAEVWLERRLITSGLTRRETETPAEFLSTVAHLRPDKAAATQRFAARVDEAMFASHPLTLAERDHAIRDAKAIGESGR